jgi:uncharacterized repeat protein (TIGR01451 family)
MKMHGPRRIVIFSSAITMATMMMAGPLTAGAAPPSSEVSVNPTTVQQGQTFTVTQTVFNPQDFTVTAAKPSIFGKELSIVSATDLVSCTGTTVPCFAFGSSYRAPVGDLPPGESRTVTITLRVKDDAPVGAFTLQHQLVGDNFSFETFDGPVVTITATAQRADLAVAIDASPRGVLTSQITYAIAVTNTGPANATGVRITSTYASGLLFVGSSNCARVGTTRNVSCDIPALAAGATATVRYTAAPSLLLLGQFTTRAQRTQSTPTDPNTANDTATKTCTAVTGLLVSC